MLFAQITKLVIKHQFQLIVRKFQASDVNAIGEKHFKDAQLSEFQLTLQQLDELPSLSQTF